MWHVAHIMGLVTVWLFDESACHLVHFHFPRCCGISISHLIIYAAIHLHLYTFLLPFTVASWRFYCLHEDIVILMMPFCLLVCPFERILVGEGVEGKWIWISCREGHFVSTKSSTHQSGYSFHSQFSWLKTSLQFLLIPSSEKHNHFLLPKAQGISMYLRKSRKYLHKSLCSIYMLR